MAWIKLRDIDEKLDVNRLNILEEIDNGTTVINYSIGKIHEDSQIIKNNISKSNNKIIREISILKDNNLALEQKINDLDNKLNCIVELIKNLSIQLDKTIKDSNKDISKKLNKESKERKDSLKGINSELRNLSELTKIMIVNDMASILEEA